MEISIKAKQIMALCVAMVIIGGFCVIVIASGAGVSTANKAPEAYQMCIKQAGRDHPGYWTWAPWLMVKPSVSVSVTATDMSVPVELRGRTDADSMTTYSLMIPAEIRNRPEATLWSDQILSCTTTNLGGDTWQTTTLDIVPK